MRKYLVLIISFIYLFVGCDDKHIKNEESESYYSPSKKNISITNSNQVEKISKTSDSQIVLNIASPKDIYLVVTSHFNNQKISIKSSISSLNLDNRVTLTNLENFRPNIPIKVIEFRENVHKLLNKKPSNKDKTFKSKRAIDDIQEGISSFDFCVDMDKYTYDCTERIKATARKVVKDIPTKYGNRNLIIWVEDDEYNSNELFSIDSITQDMVEKLANQFLQNDNNSTYDNDIYDWDSNIFGQEWGSDAKEIDQNLIDSSNTIEILIYNMHTNSLAGYFWPKDNFVKSYIRASNEKIMFYINSELYANNEKETFTTLAHELQHMIHFYQRDVKLQIEDPTWYNEMMSEATEDLLAVKLKHVGPRSVDYRNGAAEPIVKQYIGGKEYYGRYPGFNRNNTLSLTYWGTNGAYYSLVSSFGAFLLRNYNGAKVLHNMMYSEYTGRYAVEDATKEKFNTLLNRWGVGVILSDIEDLDSSKPRYNFGDFIESSYGGIKYKLGSINFFNYNPKPTFKNSEILNKDANLYYKVGENLSGTIKLNVTIQKGGDITIIAK